MKTFTFYLVKFRDQKKKITITANNLQEAFVKKNQSYGDWDISMFWQNYP